jgi:hypothetical protein
MGKSDVFFARDDENDSAYFYYESNGNVSIYFLNPGFTSNYNQSSLPDDYLTGVAGYIFRRWITFPIASKDSNQTIYSSSGTDPITITGQSRKATISAKIDFIGDSTISTLNVSSQTSLTAKHCRITITALWDNVPLTQTRDYWFVPKIGYFAKIIARTNIPDTPQGRLDVIPVDTTSTIKILTSFILHG